jgi:transcriptional regulator with GAF, ATPase, and Fis domain
MQDKNIDQTLRKLDRTQYHQHFLTVAVILFLAAFITVMFLYSDIRGLYRQELGDYTFGSLVVGFSVLSLLFVSYISLKEKAAKATREILVKEKIAGAVLELEREKLQTLLEVNYILNSRIDQQKVFDTICYGIAACLKADQSSLMLYDSRTDQLRCVACHGGGYHLILNKEVKLGEGIAGWVAQQRMSLLLAKDVPHSKFINFTDKERRISSSICVPLELGGEVKGVLNVNIMDREDREFDENDLRIAKIFAQNAVVALDRSWQSEKPEESKSTKLFV